MIRRSIYPICIQNNIFPSNSNLFVSQAHFHTSAPGEISMFKNAPSEISIGYIVSGSYLLNNVEISTGNGFLFGTDNNKNTVISRTKNDSLVKISIGGHSARKFLSEFFPSLLTHTFSHPYSLEIAELIKNVACSEYENRNIDFILTALLYNVMSFYKKQDIEMQNTFAPATTPTSNQYPYLQDIIKYIDKHYSESLSLSMLAELVHLSPNYISRIFKKTFGYSLQQYIIHYRMGIAENLLCNSTYSIGTIAGMVGCPDAQHFSQLFKSIYQYTPSKYRELTTIHI